MPIQVRQQKYHTYFVSPYFLVLVLWIYDIFLNVKQNRQRDRELTKIANLPSVG